MNYTSPFPTEFDTYQAIGYQNMHTQGTIFAVLDNSGKSSDYNLIWSLLSILSEILNQISAFHVAVDLSDLMWIYIV